MGVHELHRHDEDEPFDPRQEALAHAGTAAYLAHQPEGSPLEGVFAEAANALTNGLVYVGDQILRQNALLGVQMMDDPNDAVALSKRVSEVLGVPPAPLPHDEAVSRAAQAIAECLEVGPVDPTMIAKRVVGAMFPLFRSKGVRGGVAGD